MGVGGGGGVEGQGAYNRINSKESASKQGIKHCWSEYILKVLPGGGGLITELILKKVFRNKVLKTADQNTFWRYLFFYASL